MKHILALSVGSSRKSSSEIVKFGTGEIRITHLGVDFDAGLFASVLKSYDGKCDAICISYMPPTVMVGRKARQHEIYAVVDDSVRDTPVFFGFNLRSIYMNWSVRNAMEKGDLKTNNANVLFLSGLAMHDLAKTLEPLALSARFLDAWTYLRAPVSLKGVDSLDKYAGRAAKILSKRPLRSQKTGLIQDRLFHNWFRKQIKDADILVSPSIILENFDLKLLKGKTLLLDSLPDSMGEAMKKAGVQNVFYTKPLIEGADKSYNYAISEALIAFIRGQENTLSQEDILDYFNNVEIDAKMHQLDPLASEIPRKFAFVVHPLAQRDLFRHPLLKPIGHLPKPLTKKFEQLVAKAPGALYGRITGVRSEATGGYAEGLIYCVFATPREMMKTKPEKVYRQMIDIAAEASKQGAKIMGLGAFTKIVGDAGVTIAARSAIPVTTGNSLSAAATLWAAKEACRKMNIMKVIPGTNMIEGTVMIIGATGSIGKACTSVLGANFNTIIIAAINAPRLIAFQKELKEMYPHCKVQITTQPERFASQCDLIVISTSATEGGAFTIDNVKPGCVICDVSRPLTFTALEAMKRPDVLIIESGEIELPGDNVYISFDVGLEKQAVYACLAETALLALEGRYESFTLSRNVNYKKVKEIYKIARKHGARLAEIRSPNGVITDEEIDLCREHALIALKKLDSTAG